MLWVTFERALLSEPAYLLWNGIGSVCKFDLGFFGHFVGGWSSWRKAEDVAATLTKGSVLPTECAEDEVHDKEGAEEDEGAEVDPGPRRPARVLHLTTGQKAQGRKTKTNKNTKNWKKKKGARGSKKG